MNGLKQDIWVFCEAAEGEFLPVSYELLGKAGELAPALNASLTAITAGHRLDTEKLTGLGVDKIIMCDAPYLKYPSEILYAEAISPLITERRPAIILFGATDLGRALAPRLAATHRAGLTADCTALEIDPETGLLRQTRPAFGGNLMATIITKNHSPQMATVRPGVFPAPAPVKSKKAIIETLTPAEADTGVSVLESKNIEKGFSIADSEMIISAGRGIGSKKNLELVFDLAELIGASVGVSRPIVDMGWCDYTHQIGQTGLSVSPRLLIACGISGAIQHLAGIGGAEKIIAINSDPEAQIFTVADYSLVGDCVEILEGLIGVLTPAPLVIDKG